MGHNSLLQWAIKSHCDKPSRNFFSRSECHIFGWTNNLRRNVTVVNCYRRRFVWCKLCLGRNVAWLIRGWTDREGTMNYIFQATLMYKLPARGWEGGGGRGGSGVGSCEWCTRHQFTHALGLWLAVSGCVNSQPVPSHAFLLLAITPLPTSSHTDNYSYYYLHIVSGCNASAWKC